MSRSTLSAPLSGAHRAEWSPAIWAVAILAMAWVAATAWARPLLLPDEGRYVGVAWEMLRSGDWLTPTLDGLPYFHKPPLFYWITAASVGVFGPHELAARMAPMLGATLMAVSTFAFIRRWAGADKAKATLVALGAQPLFLVGGQFANLDMLVAGCITATITLLAHAALSAEQGRREPRALLAAYAMAALGVLAKGLIGFVIPGLAISAWLLLRGRWRGIAGLWSMTGVLLFFAVAGPWFVLMQLKFPGFLHYFFVVQHFDRFAAGGFNNAQPFWFYAAVLVLFFLPWLFWLMRSLVRRPAVQADATHSLMVVWALAVVAFFSLPKSKLLGYILPAIPALAYLAADGFIGHHQGRALRRRAWIAVAVVAVALSTGAMAWLTMHHPKSARDTARDLAAARTTGEPVLMLDNYYFDLPFYAGLRAPVVVVEDWSDVDVTRRDTWRKELADAGHFAPTAAAVQLIEPKDLAARLCKSPQSWVIGPPASVDRHPGLAAADLVSRRADIVLWRVDTRSDNMIKALGCEGTPNGGSASR